MEDERLAEITEAFTKLGEGYTAALTAAGELWAATFANIGQPAHIKG
jgi:hypothetical protein